MNSGYVRLWAVGAVNLFLFLCAGCAKTEIRAEEVPIFTKETPALAAEPKAKPIAADEAAEGKEPASARDTNAPPADPAVKVVQTPTAPKNLQLSPALEEVAKLAQAGLSEEVMLSYIVNSTNIYNLTSDEIVYLNDLGVSSTVISELIKRDNSPEARELKRASTAASPLPPGIALNAPATNIYYNSRPAPGTTATEPAPANDVGQEPQPVTTVPASQYAVADPVAVEAPAVAPFYEPLSPYGNWVQVENYGLCWQPTVAVVNRSWRPYGDHGRWYWSDAGWYWYSDYSWGWAPFHYGRWCTSPRVGWFWVPDTVWGPSWVTWRYSDNYCGWAPLPPRCDYVSGFGLRYRNSAVSIGLSFGFSAFDYNFVAWNRFYDHSPHHHFAHHSQKNVIFKESTVVNNYVVGNNNTIINEGVGLQRAAKRARTEISRVPIRSAPLPANRAARPERLVNEGSTLAVVRPELPGRPVVKPASDARPPRSDRSISPQRPVRGDGNIFRRNVSSPAEAQSSPLTTDRTEADVARNRPQVASRESETVRALFGAPGRPQRKRVGDHAPTIAATPGGGSASPAFGTESRAVSPNNKPSEQPAAATAPAEQRVWRNSARPSVSDGNGTSFGRPIDRGTVARAPFEPVARPQSVAPSRPALTQPNRVLPAPVRNSSEPNRVATLPSSGAVIPSRPIAPSIGSFGQQPSAALRTPPPITSSPAPITRNPTPITRSPAPITRGAAPITRGPAPLASPAFRPQASVQPQFVAPPQRPSVSAPASRPAPVVSSPPPVQSSPSPSGRPAGQSSSGGGGRPQRSDGNR